MSPSRTATPFILTLSVVAVVGAQQPTAQPRAYERPVHTVGAGPQKLRVDVPLLTGGQRFTHVQSVGETPQAQGGLADLRLFDVAGRELAYLLIAPSRPRASWVAGTVLPVAQTQKTSGFELDLGQMREVDGLVLDDLPAPFLKRFLLEGSGDRSRWTVLIDQGTLFDLPEERVRQTHAAFAPGPYRYLRLIWDDTNSARVPLPRSARVRETTSRLAPEPLRFDVPVQGWASEPGRSRYRIQLPAAGLPIASLLIHADAGDIFRMATVNETRFSGARAEPVELGRARLVRTRQQSGAGASLRIDIEPPRGSELQLVVDDGSNPPLAIEKAAVESAELPWIYFEAPGGPVVARYGDLKATAPRYDLEARRTSVNLGSLPEASWGEPRPTSATDGASVPVPALPDRGAFVDVTAYQYRRALQEGKSGLVALQLDPAVLSHSRGPQADFADVRIVDDHGNQVPYLVERRDEPLRLSLAAEPAAPQVRALKENTEGNRSIYRITLPYPQLPAAKLVLETSDRVFRRSLQIGVERPPDRRRRDMWFDVLAAPTWQHADPQNPAPHLEIGISPGDQTNLLLIVEEGDNRPLAITSVRLLLPSWRLRFFRPSESLRLIYGNRDVARPDYDLALLAPAVMGGVALQVDLAAEEARPSTPVTVLSPRLFWLGLGLAVVVLLALIVRLISSAPPPPPSPPAP